MAAQTGYAQGLATANDDGTATINRTVLERDCGSTQGVTKGRYTVTERQKLIRKLEAMLDEFAAGKHWGTIEIELRDGAPNFVRKMITEKLNGAQENTRARYENSRH